MRISSLQVKLLKHYWIEPSFFLQVSCTRHNPDFGCRNCNHEGTDIGGDYGFVTSHDQQVDTKTKKLFFSSISFFLLFLAFFCSPNVFSFLFHYKLAVNTSLIISSSEIKVSKFVVASVRDFTLRSQSSLNCNRPGYQYFCSNQRTRHIQRINLSIF